MKTLKTALVLILAFCLTVPGVFAMWMYFNPPVDIEGSVDSSLGSFTYGLLYITKIEITGGEYSSAEIDKKSDLNISADIKLGSSASSAVNARITLYNSTSASYYYNETQTVSTSNKKIGCTVSGIEQKEEVPSKTYKTFDVSFGYESGAAANTSLISEIHFNFVIDKDSIGAVVAESAITRFADILNNADGSDTYQKLKNAMNNRGSNSSSVSFVGNVAGADDDDSKLIKELFTEEFLTMDLDGDGASEPITLMIKRENLDGNTNTGDSYTYKNLLGSNRTVNGVEFTLYITSEGFDQKQLTVYAATYTILEGDDKWTEVVPFTKGTADANRYTFGWGDNNSFNTDTWESENGKSMDDLTKEYIAKIK